MFRKRSYFIFILFIFLCLLIPLFSSIGDDSLQNEPRLTFLIVGGSDGVAKRFGDLNQLRALLNDEKRSACDKILLALAEEPLPQKEIVTSIDLATEIVRDLLTMLESLDMISTFPLLFSRSFLRLKGRISLLLKRRS